ncbi:spherulation-specific family 4 protein [Streptomyces sp. NPDC018019]|uniref:spherulation-specific family 4 protein n=1 Tax=Streptomyces sp. NPDC018019 TaxID=3365030 RepID=UPI0037BD691A
MNIKKHLTGALARLRLVTRPRASLVAISILGTALAVVPGASPAAAAPLRQTSIITNNIQGESDHTAAKWNSQVESFARSAEIVLIQEAGPQGPSGASRQADITTADGDTVRYSRWRARAGRLQPDPHHVFFIQTDDNGGRGQGGRVNIATITRQQPDEVRVVTNPVQAGRAALGVRFGNDWYFNVHGLSGRRTGDPNATGGGADSATLLTAIRDSVRSWGAHYQWTAGGDFNIEPEQLQRRATFPSGSARVYNPGRPTHQSGRELDYFVSSDADTGGSTATVPRGAGADHYPVQWGGLRAAAEPPEMKVMPLGDSTFGTSEWAGYGTVLAGSLSTIWMYLAQISKRQNVPVDFVGSDSPGHKGDPAYEGAPGEEIDAIAKRSAQALPKYRPNIVTLQAGTYDMKNGKQDGAAQRLKSLVDQIQQESPSTVVAVATLGPSTDSTVQSRITAYNAEIRTMVDAWQSAGRHVVLADTSALTTSDLSGDGLTPNDSGTKKIAEAFDGAIRYALLMGWVADPGSGDGGDTGDGGQDDGFGQQVAVAAYTSPVGDPKAWDRMIGASSDKMSVLVANVLNGPGSQPVEEWRKVIDRAHASGKRVLGYVDTGYFGQADNRRTRLGSLDAADWVAQIEQDVNTWYQLYGSSIDGIFFDDGFNACGDNNKFPALYSEVNDYVKRLHRGALTVLNPGTIVPQCYEGSADILLTYEGSYAGYFGKAANPELNYKPLGWTPKSSSEIWHIIYDVPADGIDRTAKAARDRGAGYVQITDDVMPNPYDQQPGADYLAAEQAAVPGGTPKAAPPTPYNRNSGTATPAPPDGLKATATDYSSSSIQWQPVADAARYVVRVNGEIVAVLPGSMHQATLGGLEPGGTSYTLSVNAQSAAGRESAASNSVTVKTESLPGGRTVGNVKVAAGADSTTVSADFYVPYSFRRVYFWKDSSTEHDDSPCWPINTNQWGYVCAQYMMENNTLMSYTGTKGEWSWSPMGSATPSVDGYTYSWKLPIGTSKTLADHVVIQAEGYGPRADVFTPCPAIAGGPDGKGRYCAK